MCCVAAFILLSVFAAVVVTVSGFLYDCNNYCGLPIVQPHTLRIVGGTETVAGSLPWMAMLASCGNFACGGAILNHQFIISAAHCFLEDGNPGCNMLSPNNWDVFLGKSDVQKFNFGEVQIKVQDIYIHPLYDNTTHTSDIALLKLAQNISFNSLISPVCLPTAVQTPRDNQTCIVAGFGETFSVDRFSLHHVAVPIVSDEQCLQSDWYGLSGMYFPPSQLCAGYENGGRDACYGDSGSPLICKFGTRWYANGIVSIGQRCGLPRQPGIYSNVTHHENWIRNTMVTNGNLLPCDIF